MELDLNKFLLATGVALTLVAAPAKADTSIAIGVTAHSSTWDTAGHEKEVSASGVAGANEINSTTHSHDADYGSYFIEIVQKEGLAGMTFGVAHTPGEATIGTKSRTDAESPADTDSDDGTYTAKAEVSDYYLVYVEPTFYFNDNFGIYGKLGATHLTVRSKETLQSGGAYGDEQVYGGMLGLGVRAITPMGIFVKTEWTKTEYQSVELASTTGNSNIIEADTDQEAVSISIGFQF